MNFGHVDLKVLLGYPGGLVTLAVGCWYLVGQIWDFSVCKESHRLDEACIHTNAYT